LKTLDIGIEFKKKQPYSVVLFKVTTQESLLTQFFKLIHNKKKNILKNEKHKFLIQSSIRIVSSDINSDRKIQQAYTSWGGLAWYSAGLIIIERFYHELGHRALMGNPEVGGSKFLKMFIILRNE